MLSKNDKIYFNPRFSFFQDKKPVVLNNGLTNKNYAEEVRPVPLDISKKFVRTPEEEFKVLMSKMRSYSGRVIATDKDYDRGYTSTCLCGRKRIDADYFDSPVSVVSGAESNKLYYSGLMKCGSVWRCPVCSFKITQRRQLEVFELANTWLELHEKNTNDLGRLSFITLTLRHNKHDHLDVLLDRLGDEFRKFQRTQVYKRLEQEHNIRGFIKTLEIKWSWENGWHPHLHLLYFHTSKESAVFHKEFLHAWCKRKRINALLKAQCAKDVYTMKGITEYITKWDMSKEMTQGNSKINENENTHYSPFLILRKLTENKWGKDEKSQYEKTYFGGLFYHYSRVTKGKHLINISKSLKKEMAEYEELAKIEIKTDAEILEDQPMDSIKFKIDPLLWNRIVFRDAMPYILLTYENGGLNQVSQFLTSSGIVTDDLQIKYDKKCKLLYCRKKAG